MSDYDDALPDGPRPRPTSSPARPRNPYLIALWVIAIVTLAVGLILLGAGAQVRGPEIDGIGGPDVGQLAVGGSLFQLGVVAALLALVASAITWRKPVA